MLGTAPSNGHTLISFGDLWRIIRRRKGVVFGWMAACGLLAASGALLRPVYYETEASFLDRGAQTSNLQGAQGVLGALMGLSNESGNHATVEIFKSHRLLRPLAQKHSLQASLIEVGQEPTLLGRMQDNLSTERAYWLRQIPTLRSLPPRPVFCTAVNYTQELPTAHLVQFVSEEEFKIITPDGVLEGQLGAPVQTNTFTFTLQRRIASKLAGKQFILALEPLPDVAEKLYDRLSVAAHKECGDLILLTLRDPDRQLASTLLDDLMEGYHDYLTEQNKNLAKGQLAYLAKRKHSATEDLHMMLNEHAITLAAEANQTGILSAKDEITYLGAARAKTKQLLLEIDAELCLLEQIKPGDADYIKTLSTANKLPTPIANCMQQIHTLRLRRDGLRHALNQSERARTPVANDMEGIDLEMANRLYLSHAEKLNALEMSQRQNNFTLEQLADPTFEVSSISSAVQDSISAGIIKRSAQASLELKETDYRSQRELDRTKKELAQDREFLISHLTQTNRLEELQKEFLREKIYLTQKIMLALIERELEAANEQLAEFVKGRAMQLRQERAAGLDTLANIRQQMVQIPKAWAAEVLLEQVSATNSKLAEEVAKLVETKNIAHHLEVIQSGPLDRATVPVVPLPPHLLLITMLGLIAGGFLGTLALLFKELINGIPASRTNLYQLGLQVVATIPKQPPQKLLGNLFLRLQHAVLSKKPSIVLVLTGLGPDYTAAWAESLTAAGKKVLRIDLCAFDPTQETSASYDLTIVASCARADSIEAKIATSTFEHLIISVRDERLQDLDYLRNKAATTAIILIDN